MNVSTASIKLRKVPMMFPYASKTNAASEGACSAFRNLFNTPLINLLGMPVIISIAANSNDIILVLVSNMIFVAIANTLPVRNVSTVSWKGSTHDKPLWLIKGTTASKKYDSITHNSKRTRSNKLAIIGPYSLTLSDPIIAPI